MKPQDKKPSGKVSKLYNKPVKPAKKTGDKDAEFLRIARERARDGATFWSDNWTAAEEDLIFLSGDQWPSTVRTERELEGRPCLTNNVLPTFVDQVLGDQRQNRPAIKVSAVDMAHVENEEGQQEELKISNKAGSKDYSLAECFTGIIKNIEYNCDAETAYDSVFEASCQSGLGFLRVLTDYVADDSFEQDILIKDIENQFSVVMDPSAKEKDYSDMGWCFIDDNMLKEDFKEQYPDASYEPVSDSSDTSSWFADKTVKISEYFIRKPVMKEAALLSDGRMVFMDELEPVVDELMEQGITIERTRKVKTHKVCWYKISGRDVLEGPIELDCSTIPVVPVWGKRISIKKKTIYRSIIRHSKDAQRMANYWDSAATEAVALAPKAPFIGSEGHIEGREDEWNQANTKNLAILTYIPQFQGDPGPRREQPAAVPAAEITLGMNSTDKIKATLGMFDASIGNKGNETSGRAILARQREADVGSFAFIDNLSKAIRRVGKIVVELVPKTIDTERVMRLKFADDTEDYVILNQKIFDDESGEWITIHDLGIAKYDVVVKTGPAYTTQRQEAAEAMIQFAQAVPAAAAVMADLIAQNMDWPGADELTERLKKIVPPNILSSKEREDLAKDQPEEQPPTPEQQLMAQELELKGKELEVKAGELDIQAQELEVRRAEAEADIEKSKADVIKAQLQTETAQLKYQEIEAGAVAGNMDMQRVKEMIAEALTQLLPELVK